MPITAPGAILPAMVSVTDEDTAAIQAAFNQHGELSAALEVTRRFRAITGERAREWARLIAAWKPIEVKPRSLPSR